MGKYPIALAPGMGINAFFAFTVVIGMGVPWETALAGTFVSGFIFLILTLTKVRETIINAISEQLKLAVAAGIGLFIAFIFTLLFVDFFDTAGTLMAVTKQAGLLKDGKLPRAGKALGADSIATIAGATLGTSTTTSYIESSAGVAVGGRTGLTAVVTAGFFLIALFFSPLLGVITAHVTAPALIIVGVLMAGSLANIQWDKLEFAIPAFLTAITMPLTFSISTGTALGFIIYPLMMMFKGDYKKVHPIMYVLFFVFLAYFIWLA